MCMILYVNKTTSLIWIGLYFKALSPHSFPQKDWDKGIPTPGMGEAVMT